jgi:hypothetical protein
MRLLQSVLPGLRQTKKPQRTFLAHLFGLLLMLLGHATLRNGSVYRACTGTAIPRGRSAARASRGADAAHTVGGGHGAFSRQSPG